MTPHELASKHLNAWFADGVSRPGDGKKTLEGRVVEAIEEAVASKDAEIATLKQARDDAVEAVKIACEQAQRR